MIIKMIEIRDSATCIAAMAIKMVASNPIEYKFLWREGYPKNGSSITLMKLSDQKATNDPYDPVWQGARTMKIAHHWIIDNFDEINSGDVVDVQLILEETNIKKSPEIWTD